MSYRSPNICPLRHDLPPLSSSHDRKVNLKAVQLTRECNSHFSRLHGASGAGSGEERGDTSLGEPTRSLVPGSGYGYRRLETYL